MHRSGTSLTARLLGDLGWYLGRPDELLGPREDNPDGFFERADVQVLNDRVLSRLGASWDGPPAPEELHALGESVDEQLATLVTEVEKDAGPAPFALKDPRLCVLWPLWERHLPPSTTLVLTFRHPAEVAASLQKRDGLPLVTGLALWEEYVRRALAAAEYRAAVVVRYGELVEQPESSIEALAGALGATVPSDWAEAVRPELYRNRRSGHEVPLTRSQRELWAWIEQAPTSVDRIDPDDLPGGQEESSIELVRSRRDTAALHAEIDRLQRSLAESGSELERQSEQHSTSEQKLRDARDESARELRAATIELAVLRDQVRHHQTVRGRLESQIARDSERSVRLVEERELLDQHVEALRQRRLEQAQRIRALQQESQETQVLLDRLRNELAEKDSLARSAQARERVLLHERQQLLRAVMVVEGQRRAQEAAVATLRGSRTLRWARKLASPLRPGSSGRGEA